MGEPVLSVVVKSPLSAVVMDGMSGPGLRVQPPVVHRPSTKRPSSTRHCSRAQERGRSCEAEHDGAWSAGRGEGASGVIGGYLNKKRGEVLGSW